MTPTAFDTATVFIIDDDDAVRRALALTLDLEGYKVRTFSTAEDLLSQRLPERGAFLVVDNKLPGLSGMQVLNLLRRRGVELPAAIMTSHPQQALRIAAKAAGTPILDKPLSGETLINAVRAGLALTNPR